MNGNADTARSPTVLKKKRGFGVTSPCSYGNWRILGWELPWIKHFFFLVRDRGIRLVSKGRNIFY